jgi:Cu2+-exporting ATPase
MSDHTHHQMPATGTEGDRRHGRGDHTGHEETFRRRFWICLALSIPVLVWSETIQGWLGYTAPAFTGSDFVVPVLATVVFVYGGLPFLQMSRWELAARRPAMMTLISLAITVAFAFSLATVIWDGLGEDFFWELVTLIDIMLLGHWIEMRSVRLASGALEALASLMPDTAEVIGDDGRVQDRYVDELKGGDTVMVRPGAAVPADGVVVDGTTDLDEAMITGESQPVSKETGDSVIAGTVNSGDGSLRVRVTAVGDDTALAGIMRLVADAEASKSSTQLFADRAAGFLFYAALAAAAVTAVVWTAIDAGAGQQVVARVVTVLVIACPHALGLAIPLVVANTTSIAASNGTLIRDREAIDTAKDLEVIVFDKTGTLTEGRIGVTALTSLPGITKHEALRIAAAAEGDSEHLMAAALRREADTGPGDLPRVEGFEIIKGRGVLASVDGVPVHVGGPRMVELMATPLPAELEDFTSRFGNRGESVIYLFRDGEPVAAFALSDVVREESRQAIDALHEMGVEVAMLTGDSKEVARAVAGKLGIDRYFAQVLPADKEVHIRELQSEGKMVGMVGDGVNDAPALARADIGIAIGSGTDVAVQAADLVLVKSNPLDIVRILKLSEAAYRKQKQNIWWAAGYNIVMIPLAAGVLAPWGFTMPPAIGALLMSVSTIVVAINAQLLRQSDLGVSSRPGEGP